MTTQVHIQRTSTAPTMGMWFQGTTGGTSVTSTTSAIQYPTSSSSTTAVYYGNVSDVALSGDLTISPGQALRIKLPDGALLDVAANGSYKVVDDDAKVIYKASRVREFNRYLNASDLLEEFIKFVAGIGHISKREFFNLPVELFIQWLVIRAAEADGDEPDYTPVVKALPNLKKRHAIRCKCCGKFIRNRELLFCNTEHMTVYATKRNVFG